MEIERIRLPQPDYDAVNVYRIGDTLVDTGHPAEASRTQCRDELAGGRLDGVERVVLTHGHVDHVGGSLVLPDLTSLPHVAFEGIPELLSAYPTYLEAARGEWRALLAGLSTKSLALDEYLDRYFPLTVDYRTDALSFQRVVGPDDSIRIGKNDFEVVPTFGHASGHMALFHRDSGVMLSGDVLWPTGHFMYGPLCWDVGAHKRSLRRIRELAPERLLPGHGEPLSEPLEVVRRGLDNVRRTEDRIVSAVEQRGELAAHELAKEALAATDASLEFLTLVASAYAVHLAESGRLTVQYNPNILARPP